MKSRRHIAPWRHLLRIAVLLALFLIAGFNLHRRYKSQYGGQFEIEKHPGLHLIDTALGESPHLDRRPITVSGGLWSFKAGPVRISDPLAMASGILTSRRFSVALMLSILLPALGILFGGRIFCSWICPMGILGEIVRGGRRKLAHVGVHFIDIPVSALPKYVLLVLGCLACLLFSVPFFYGFYPPRIISDAMIDLWTGEFMKLELAFVGILLLCELILCERLWCRCLCPGGALLAWLGRFRRLRVQRDPDACTACGACDLACPYNLDPSHKPLGGECDNCGRCIEVCDDNAIDFTLNMSKRNHRSGSMPGVVLALLMTVAAAHAHHIRGIPHYSYQENYPQAPLFEEFRDSGPWTLQFTFWPIPAQKALDLALYVKHTATDVPYDGAVTFRVYQHGEDLSEGNHPFEATANPRHIHKVGWVYEEDGIYYAEISLGEGGQAVKETFRFQVGKVKPNVIAIALITACLLLLIATVAIIKKRQLSHQPTTA